MTDASIDAAAEAGTAQQPAAPLADPASAVKLRGDPPRVMRQWRKAMGFASSSALAVVGAGLLLACRRETGKGATDL